MAAAHLGSPMSVVLGSAGLSALAGEVEVEEPPSSFVVEAMEEPVDWGAVT